MEVADNGVSVCRDAERVHLQKIAEGRHCAKVTAVHRHEPGVGAVGLERSPDNGVPVEQCELFFFAPVLRHAVVAHTFPAAASHCDRDSYANSKTNTIAYFCSHSSTYVSTCCNSYTDSNTSTNSNAVTNSGSASI